MAKSLNNNLKKAKEGKNDEFYTELSDIEKELKHYKSHFKDKVVFCNCDDPRVSNFFHYFSFNFEVLGLKKLITTCYKSNNPDLFSQNEAEKAISIEYKRNEDGNLIPYPEFMELLSQEALYKNTVYNPNIPQPNDIGIRILKGDGDFRSPECVELLKQADIVVTNPPFSLFREYVAQLIEYNKKFLIIGSLNSITYKEIFSLIKENKLWLGYGFSNGNAYFKTPHVKEFANGVYDEKTGLVKFRNCGWFTNLDLRKRHEDLILYKTYYGNENQYPKYDNLDAINVDKVSDIPMDFDGVMGVPITFIDKYNPEQFEIIGNEYDLNIEKGRGYIDGKRMYSRVFIKNKRI